MDKHRVIAQMRVKADSTTFPEEAEALRAKADKLEAKYGTARPEQPYVPFGFRPPRPRGGNASPDYQKVAEDYAAWKRGPQPPPYNPWSSNADPAPQRPFTINDLNDMMRTMHEGRPIQGGILIINGNVIRVDGAGPVGPSNFTQTSNGATVHINFNVGGESK